MFAVALGSIALLSLGFLFYSRWLASAFEISDEHPTPAVRLNDGEDYIPTRPAILLSQHFAAIAAVGPIAGPIIAGIHYGWFPGMLWIVLGAIFIGAVHDFSTLVASVRHGARSISEVLRQNLGKTSWVLFSIFIWISLIYVIVVFADLTAGAFVSRPELGAENFGPGVASSSFLYLGLAVIMGLCLYRFRMPLRWATLIFVPAVLFVIFLGQKMPVSFSGDVLTQQRAWDGIILVYCFAASMAPLWILLQPRGYLGGFILYATFIAGISGILFGDVPAAYPSRQAGHSWPFFPVLFTTIACGACSGFHGLVSSGTTSRQLAKESHARIVGYGGMLLEALVAVIAMATVMIVAPGARELGLGPDEIYARGLAHFMGVFGIPFAVGVSFGKLAFATFIYDTLDVATRLGRYVFQELTGLRGRMGAFWATLATLSVPALVIFVNGSNGAQPLWKIFWPVFGASNQLLAALSLTAVTVWLKASGKNWLVTGIPAVFMSAVTLSSLSLLVKTHLLDVGRVLHPVGTSAFVLILLAVFILGQSLKVFFMEKDFQREEMTARP